MSKHQLWNELGNIYINSGAFEEAIQAYRKSIEISPDFGWAYNNMALAYMRLGQPEISIPYYQRSIELLSEFKDKAVAWHRMGNSYQVMDDIENAVLAFQRAVNLDLDNTSYRHDLAVAKAEYAYEEEEIEEAEALAVEKETPEMIVEDKETETFDVTIAEEESVEQGEYSSWIEKTIEKIADKVLKKKTAAFEYETIVFPEGVAPEEAVAELMTLVEGHSLDALLSVDEELAEKETGIEEFSELEIEEQAVEIPLSEEEDLEEDSSIELPVLENEADEATEELADENSDDVEMLEPETLGTEVEEEAEVAVVEEETREEEQIEVVQRSASPIPAAIAKDLIPAFAAVQDEELDASLQSLMSEISQEIDIEENGRKVELFEEDTFFEAEQEEEFSDDFAEVAEEAVTEVVDEAVAEVVDEAVAEVAEEEAVEAVAEVAEEAVAEVVDEAVAEVAEEEAVETVAEEAVAEVVEETIEEEAEEAVAEVVEEAVAEVVEEAVAEVVEEAVAEVAEETVAEEAVEVVVAEAVAVVRKEESLFNKIISGNGNGNGDGNGNGNGSASGISSARVWSELGNVFYKEGIFDGAQIAYKKAIELDDKFGLAFNNLALLHVQDGKYEEAVQLYETSISLIENSTAQAVSWNNLGNAHRALKAYEEAEKAYRKADDLVGEKIAIENLTRYGLLDDTSAS